MTRTRTKHPRTAGLQLLAAAAAVCTLTAGAAGLGYRAGARSAETEPEAVQLVAAVPETVPDWTGLLHGADLYSHAPVTVTAPRYTLSDTERDLVERVVMAESGNQTTEGQMAVAQCILNTAEATGQRPDAVVLAPNQYADPAPRDTVTDSVRTAVRRVFDNGETVTAEPIRFFYAPQYSTGRWHESALEYVTTIGGHRFFKAPGA